MIVLANYEVAGVDQYDYLPVSLDDISELMPGRSVVHAWTGGSYQLGKAWIEFK